MRERGVGLAGAFACLSFVVSCASNVAPRAGEGAATNALGACELVRSAEPREDEFVKVQATLYLWGGEDQFYMAACPQQPTVWVSYADGWQRDSDQRAAVTLQRLIRESTTRLPSNNAGVVRLGGRLAKVVVVGHYQAATGIREPPARNIQEALARDFREGDAAFTIWKVLAAQATKP